MIKTKRNSIKKSNIEKYATYVLIFTINILTRVLMVKKKSVLMISNFPNGLSLNGRLISERLISDGYSVDVLQMGANFGFIGRIKYAFFCARQAYGFNTHQIILLDNYCITMNAILRKKKVKVIQFMACNAEAFKVFGMDLPNRYYTIKPVDALVTTGALVSKIYSSALNTNIENIYAIGNPRVDFFISRWIYKKGKNNACLKSIE